MFGRKGPSTSTWKPGRKQGALITAGVAVAASAVVVPITIAAWAAAAIICALWPDPDKPQSFTRQLSQKQDLMGRKAAKIAAQLRKPTATTLGFGDPGNDPYNPDAAEPWPPVRLSAWWSLFGALSLGIAALWIPVPWFCPAPARAVLSVVGGFLLFQCLAAGARAGKDNIEVGPGALLNREDAMGVIKERAAGLAAAAALGAVAAVLLFGPSLTWVTRGFAEGFDAAGTVLNSTGGTIPPSSVVQAPDAPGADASTTIVEITTTVPPTTATAEPAPQGAVESGGDEKGVGVELPALIIAALAAVAAAAAAATVFSRIYIEEQCEEWADFISKRDGWQQMWDNINMLAPTYVTTVSLPRSGGPGDPQGETHELNAFVTSNGVTWTDYAKAHESIQAALGKPFVLIRPMPQRDENGSNIMGTASPGEFTIAYPTAQLSPRAHLDSTTDPATRRLAADYRFQKAFAAAKAGTPIFMVEQALHKTRSTGVLYETMWRLPPEVDAAVLATKYHILAQALGCKWCRVGVRNADDQGRQANHEEVRIIYGDPPSKVDLKDPTQKVWLETLEWETWWRECKIVNGNGHAPRLTTSQINHRGFTEVDFALPPGIEIEHCRKAVPAMSAASGYGYIEIEPDGSGNPSLIHLVAGLKDPLNEQYLFVDYADHILSEPVIGQPNLDWAVGVGADGELMWYSWEAELPHLLLAGSSGQGKSVLESSLLAQMLHNNDPLDLEIRCIEPKNELQAIQGFEHVTRFVDFNALAPGQSFFAAAADMLQDTVEEMERRYQLMTNHPQQPRKLSEARLIARDEPPPPGMDRHPFDLPYIVVVIEECGDIFRAPTLKAEKTDHERVLHQAELIARKARAAGIYMILVTQYPTNQNIPATIKNQTRRIGLAVSGQVASMVIIDEPGLEKITAKGRGMMSYGKGYRGFRALYLRRPSEEEPDLPDDFTAFTYDVPRHGGEIGDGGNTPRQAGVRRWPVPPPGIWAEQTV